MIVPLEIGIIDLKMDMTDDGIHDRNEAVAALPDDGRIIAELARSLCSGHWRLAC